MKELLKTLQIFLNFVAIIIVVFMAVGLIDYFRQPLTQNTQIIRGE